MANSLRAAAERIAHEGQEIRGDNPTAHATGERWEFSVNGVRMVGVIRGDYIRTDDGRWFLLQNATLLERLDKEPEEPTAESLGIASLAERVAKLDVLPPPRAKGLQTLKVAASSLVHYARKSPTTKRGLRL